MTTMSPFQPSLFEQSTRVKIILSDSHELVKLTHLVNWTTLITLAATIRDSKVKKAVGPQPPYRALVGAMVLMATRKMTYREAEDMIAHYAPARYLCELMDSDRTLDHVTIFEFAAMLGEGGVAQFNTEVLKIAQGHGVLDPKQLMSDTTAQEAMIPYPTEAGLMNRFMQLANRAVGKLGGKFQGMKGKVKEAAAKVKTWVRESHLFAKGKEAKNKIGKKIHATVKAVHAELEKLLAMGYTLSSKAGKELAELTAVTGKLLPQTWHFLKTGFVAKKKIIHLRMSKLYSIVRGKAGKSVEFGIKWGINRIGGGFIQGFLLDGGKHAADQRFCLEAIKVHQAVFGAAPEVYGFDRGGYSLANIKKAKKLGVKHVGIAPTGKAAWAVSAKVEAKVKRVRAQVEGCIGTIKQRRYGFNKPQAHSTAAMARCGHSAILGFNLRKLVRECAAMEAAAKA
jgi:hypothetical protein